MKLLASLLIYFQLLNCSYFSVDYYQFSTKGDDFYEYIFLYDKCPYWLQWLCHPHA